MKKWPIHFFRRLKPNLIAAHDSVVSGQNQLCTRKILLLPSICPQLEAEVAELVISPYNMFSKPILSSYSYNTILIYIYMILWHQICCCICTLCYYYLPWEGDYSNETFLAELCIISSIQRLVVFQWINFSDKNLSLYQSLTRFHIITVDWCI